VLKHKEIFSKQQKRNVYASKISIFCQHNDDFCKALNQKVILMHSTGNTGPKKLQPHKFVGEFHWCIYSLLEQAYQGESERLNSLILSRDCVTIGGLWIDDRIYWSLDIARDCTVTDTLVSTVTSLLPLLGSGFQRRTFPFFCIPELPPFSATGFSQQQLTTTEPQQSSN
jgi:hypothetical protein